MRIRSVTPAGVLGRLILAITATAGASDGDGDGVTDAIDNCLLVANPGQGDADADGFGNACDADLDNDCAVNFSDLGVLKSVFFTSDPVADLDEDGSVNFTDLAALKAAFFGTPGPSGLFTACNTASEVAATASANSELQAAGLAVDGNLSTRWETVHGVDPGILVLDLSLSYPLSRVEIHWEAANAGTYTIDASNDTVTWVTLSSQSGGQFGDRTDVIDIAGTYRFLRMNGLTRSPGNIYGYSIWEMDVFGDAGAGIEIDIDADDDGVIDALDLCPDTPPGSVVDADGCVIGQSVQEVAAASGILVGGPGSERPGFSLYVFDDDLGTGGSACNGDCATSHIGGIKGMSEVSSARQGPQGALRAASGSSTPWVGGLSFRRKGRETASLQTIRLSAIAAACETHRLVELRC